MEEAILRCNLIYVTEQPDASDLTAMWEMHVSGILRPGFTGHDVCRELTGMRYQPE